MSTINDWWPSLISSEDADTLLSPHYDAFRAAVLEGFEAWATFAATLPEIRLALSPRSQATFVNDQVVYRLRAAFSDPPKRVRVIDDPGFLCLDFRGLILVHVKKLNEYGLPTSYPTQQQKDIAMQCCSLFPEYTDATWLILGYRFTQPLADAVDKIVIECCYADHVRWSIPLYDLGAASEPALIPFGPAPPAAQPKRVPVRAKGKKDKKKPSDE
jgi:hypothetical protein